MKKLNKKSQAGWSWAYGLSFLFALGILYTIFLYVLKGKVAPLIKDIATSTISDPAQLAMVVDGIDKYLAYFQLMPYILIIVVFIYMIMSTIYKQSGQTN